MKLTSRTLMALGVSALALLSQPGVGQTAPKTHMAVLPSQPWAQEGSDVAADPAIRYGTLPNGLRYAIMHNEMPPKQASVWLRIDAGSLSEKDNQLGLAHFMEHMAFNGTKDIPENDLIHKLERLGLQFGADLNAATGYDQTFYRLDLPSIDEGKIDTALHVLRQQVSAALMQPGAIDEERGVIQGEERLRNSPAVKVGLKQLAILAAGTRLPDRNPIGDMEIIKTAPRERFVDFYNSFYRPERATVIAVGDFNVDDMERKIKAQFADWKPTGPAGADAEFGVLKLPEKKTYLFVEKSLPPSVSLNWPSFQKVEADTLAKRRSDWVETLAVAVLNRRFTEMAQQDNPPFISATAAAGTAFGPLRIEGISTTYLPGQWEKALSTAENTVRQFNKFGVTQAELDREIRSMRTRFDQSVAATASRNTVTLAATIEADVNKREITVSPTQARDLFEKVASSITAAEVSAEAAKLFANGDPVVILNSADPIAQGEEKLAQVYSTARQVAVAPLKAPEVKAWAYTDFGKPGTIVSTSGPNALGAMKYTFANGATLTVRKADFNKNSISIGILTGIGERNFSPDKPDERGAGVGNMFPGGLSKMSIDEISRALNGRMIGGSLSTLGQRFLISAGTRPEDLDVQMQYLGAIFTDAAFRSAPFAKVVAQAPAGWLIANSSPEGAFGIKVRPILNGGDQRTAIFSPELVSTWTMDSMRDDVRRMLSEGPLDIVVVGDVEPDKVVTAVANTLGALPPRPAAGAGVPGANVRHFPAGNTVPLVVTHNGLAEQALGSVTWPTVDVMGRRKLARELSVLTSVLNLRALDVIREKEALAYSPRVGDENSPDYAGYGTISINAATAPDKLPAFYKAVEKIVADLQTHLITQDELERARRPKLEHQKNAMATNNWWYTSLLGAAYRPSTLEDALTVEEDMKAVTPTMIRDLARKYLDMKNAFKASVVPAEVKAIPSGTTTVSKTAPAGGA